MDDFLLGAIQRCKGSTVGNNLIGIKQVFILPNFSGVFTELGQAGIISLAQFIRIDNRIDMTDRRPGFVEPVFSIFQRFNQIFPSIVCGCQQMLLNNGTRFVQELGDGGFNVFRFYLGK